MEENIPNNVEEENRQHGWIWKWSTVGVLGVLCVIGAVLMAIVAATSSPHGAHSYGGESPAVVFFGNFLGLFIIFCIITTPAILVRLLARRPLPKSVGILLSLLGLFILFFICGALGEKPEMGGLGTILVLGCAYKIASSLFGLRSIGIPISLPGDRKIGNAAPEKQQETTHENVVLPLTSPSENETHQEADNAFLIESTSTKENVSTLENETAQEIVKNTSLCPLSQSNEAEKTEGVSSEPELEQKPIITESNSKKGSSNIAFGILAILAVGAMVAVLGHSAHQSEARRIEKEKRIAAQNAINARADFWNGVIEGNYTKVEQAIKTGVDVNEVREEGDLSYTALHYAVMKGNVEMVELLLHSGASVNKETKSFPNLWHMFGQNKVDNYIVGRLITILSHAGLNPNIPIIVKLSPEQKKSFRDAFEKDAKKIIKEASGEVFDAEEISKEMKPIIEEMLASGEMRTCILNVAVEKGLSDAVRVLLDGGANPNGVGEKTTAFNTPLYTAAMARRLDIVKLLVEHGANPNWKDELTGTAPLLAAIGIPGKKSDRLLVKYLVEHGANCNQTNRAGLPFIHFAALNGDSEIVKLFISNGVSINELAKTSRYTPLRMAIEYKQYECAKWLVENGANLNIEDFEHLTDAMVIYFLGDNEPKWLNLLTQSQKDKALGDIIEWQRKYAHLYQ